VVLKAWTSAHVYLGLSLVVVGTLHTGFQFGWNVHTLAYVLMMLVILSGVWGISVYASLPAKLAGNRRGMTKGQMLDALMPSTGSWKAPRSRWPGQRRTW
jgi:hypothetical protein